ncbi:MAG: hypothetical protein J2P26_07540 [Nocardiopsaceae bacterium]|nr:hypothetical protein [Nocardiopsaceae bacterium]
MGTGHERRLLTRARELADLSDLQDDTLACLGAARHAGLDPEALTGLTGCAIALGAASTATYTAGNGWTGAHPGERAFLTHVAGIEDVLDEHLHAAVMLGRQAAAALDAAREDLADARDQLATARHRLADARAQPTGSPCDGCHHERTAAITAAEAAVREAGENVREGEARTQMCEEAIRTARELAARLHYARARIESVPGDLGETYESVYKLIRAGGVLPHQGRWVTGTGPAG